VEAAFSDIGGWDTHQNQSGQRATGWTFEGGSEEISIFWKDMGSESENITLVTMSEFGRTARQNRIAGTRPWPCQCDGCLGWTSERQEGLRPLAGISNEQLSDVRDLAVTTDFRNVLGEAVYKPPWSFRYAVVFPGLQVTPGSF
jgi:uncharacterized protein (DUF1501 family)